MVHYEFTRPETWSLGKKVGLLGVIFMIVGPPFLVVAGFLFLRYSLLLIVMMIILMSVLIFMEHDIYLEKGARRIKLTYFVLMVWGAWEFIIFFSLASTYWATTADYSTFTSASYTNIIALLFIAAGFLLCSFAGLLEWRFKEVMGPQTLYWIKVHIKGDQDVMPSVHNQAQAPVRTQPSWVKQPSENPHPPTPTAPRPEPLMDNKTAGQEERTLRRWEASIGTDGQIYERCLRCGALTNIRARTLGDTIVFTCPQCTSSFTLNQ